MNANPPPRPRFSSRRPPLWRATARRGRPGGLPRFTTGSARDAINLRWNYTNEINLATGEWTRAGYRAPACYVTNAWPIVRATFSAAPADLSSVTLLAETDAAIGNVEILLPDPALESFRNCITNQLVSSGVQPTSIHFVDTSEMISGTGYAHCASNVLRRRTDDE